MAEKHDCVLVIEDLHKKFGALVATNGVNLDLRQGELHALIGPNGAGKSTLIAQICGEIAPDTGRILFDGQDITRLPAYQRARMGMGRSFQLTQLCPDFTAMENVLLSLEARNGGSPDIFRNPRRNVQNREIARTWLARVGLGEHESRIVSSLAHGQRRQLEIAVALARNPRLILLDEPMAGMGPEESASLTALLQSLKRDYPILLIEHDMDAVFALADRISVLVYGKIIFTGTASEIRAHPEVRAAYLGEEA
ncbi:branched-chain amino acid transport system ATP-binding protein [Ochrobactrum daejeonense]|uniref:Branched-chain amino acid transport system ATP-binding protein n=1 Tax=Brucella daejeonensis TaxID=659015 RepID=A0A7W9EMN1_9HYPH|nr:ABC transporter ATP-binding protein [Brucella daejeonensis]MBB5702225.1 branched-chain amino acid transport system ATP-binding protein [Brucella daejeonensis]